MANNWDARIKLLYPADEGTFFSADTVKHDSPFVVVANVEVGQDLHGFSDDHTLLVWVRNLSRSTTIANGSFAEKLPPARDEFRAELRVPIPAGWGTKAAPGDVLEVVASYNVQAGIHSDDSMATSDMFLVTKD